MESPIPGALRWLAGSPIQTCMDPPLDIPGVLAVDLLGHDGGRTVGDFD
jgi:hypothetical protein